MAYTGEEIKLCHDCENLERAVIKQAPDEVARLYGSLAVSFGEADPVRRSACMALKLACRFRGVEMVRVLVEGGAKMLENRDYAAALLIRSDLTRIGRRYGGTEILYNERREVLEVLDYLIETADKTGFDKDDLLFYAYFGGESEITDRLKKNGAVIPEMWVRIITEGGWNDQSRNKWYEYCDLIGRLSNDELVPRMLALISEIGGRRLHTDGYLWKVAFRGTWRRVIPGYFKFLFDNFDLCQVNRGELMKNVIRKNSVEALAAAAERGWLNKPKTRDEIIEFALDRGNIDCTAWLLDFKNRTADLEAERRAAEMRLERELNAPPDSPEVLSRSWSFRNRGDGTKIIKGYKGDNTEITVPEKIGGVAVTAIGEKAFSPHLSGLTDEARNLRRTITAITLPESVCEIGEGAFLGCVGLRSVNIPGGVTEIGGGVFRQCTALNAVIVARGSYAEQYCVENKIPFIYKE